MLPCMRCQGLSILCKSLVLMLVLDLPYLVVLAACSFTEVPAFGAWPWTAGLDPNLTLL